MALISCPECSVKISDKALSCPNCGFKMPITENKSELPNYMMNIRGLIFDLRPVGRLMNQKLKVQAIKELRDMTGLSLTEAMKIVESINWPSIFAE